MRTVDIPMTDLARRIGDELRRHVGNEHAITAPILAIDVRSHEREVRRCIAEETRAIQRVAGGLLCSKAGLGGGFWICTDAEQIAERYWRQHGFAQRMMDKAEAIRVAAREFGLDGVLNLSRAA